MSLTVIIGASDKPERYSYKALKMLEEHGHQVALVHPSLTQIENHQVHKELSGVTSKIDTITLYINPSLQEKIEEQLLNSKARRVIFNPGTENASLEKKLSSKGVEVERACTLVLLSTDQY